MSAWYGENETPDASDGHRYRGRSPLKNWIDLGSDFCWEDYGGLWGRRAPDGSWFVLRFTNLHEAMGEREAPCKYACDVFRVDPREVPPADTRRALECCDVDLAEIMPAFREPALVQCLVSYGIAAPLDSFTADSRPLNVRARARRAADAYRRDARALNRALDRPVNRIGSTARDFGRGDSIAGLRRYADDGKHGTDPSMDLMLVLVGGGKK
jgi:hypothetical protein